MEEKILYSMESPFQQEINVKGYYFGKNEGKERSKCNVLEYIEKLIKEREETASESIVVNWRRLHTLLSMFAKCDYIQFSQIDMKCLKK